jgi:hypothetical protein
MRRRQLGGSGSPVGRIWCAIIGFSVEMRVSEENHTIFSLLLP